MVGLSYFTAPYQRCTRNDPPLSGRSATITLLWCSMTDLNRLPHPCKGRALPAELIEHIAGFPAIALITPLLCLSRVSAVFSKLTKSHAARYMVSISHSVCSLRSVCGTGMVAEAGFEPASTAYEAVKDAAPLFRDICLQYTTHSLYKPKL